MSGGRPGVPRRPGPLPAVPEPQIPGPKPQQTKEQPESDPKRKGQT